MTKIGILGSGEVGQALSSAFMGHGYQIVLGSDHAEKTAEFKKENPELETASFEQCARLADLAVLCVKGTAAEKVVGQVKAGLSGKTVIDTTNPIADAPPQNGVLKYITSLDESLMERLQRIAPDVHFVKAFNSIGSGLMDKIPILEGQDRPCSSSVAIMKAQKRPYLKFLGNLGLKLKIWAWLKVQGQLNLWQYCGASRDFSKTSGRMLSSF